MPNLNLDAVVISLNRTPDRIDAFRRRFSTTSINISVHDGVDGLELDLELLLKQGLIAKSALKWPRGQLGCALSHLSAIQECKIRSRPLLVFEDDAIPAMGWENKLADILDFIPSGWDFLLLGWNFDSCLQMQWAAGQICTSLFQPRSPLENELKESLDKVQSRTPYRLCKAFGLAGYVVSPKGASKILQWSVPLRTLPIRMPDLPERICSSFDGQLNTLYPSLSAWVVFPPLAVGLNDKTKSQTQS